MIFNGILLVLKYFVNNLDSVGEKRRKETFSLSLHGKSTADINKLKLICASSRKKMPVTLNSPGSWKNCFRGICSQLAVNRILDGSTGERCGIKPKQNHHLLRGCVRTHGWVNFSEDTIKAEKNNKLCHTYQHISSLEHRRLFNQGRPHSACRWWTLQAAVVPTEQFSGCGANKSVTKTIIKWKLLKVFNNYCRYWLLRTSSMLLRVWYFNVVLENVRSYLHRISGCEHKSLWKQYNSYQLPTIKCIIQIDK